MGNNLTDLLDVSVSSVIHQTVWTPIFKRTLVVPVVLVQVGNCKIFEIIIIICEFALQQKRKLFDIDRSTMRIFYINT